MITVDKYLKSGYKWKMNNYGEVYYLNENKRWTNAHYNYVGSAEDQMLTDLLFASVSRRSFEKEKRIGILKSIIKNMVENRAIELNGIQYLPEGKLQEIEKTIDGDCPYFWRINYGKVPKRVRKGEIKKALSWVRQ